MAFLSERTIIETCVTSPSQGPLTDAGIIMEVSSGLGLLSEKTIMEILFYDSLPDPVDGFHLDILNLMDLGNQANTRGPRPSHTKRGASNRGRGWVGEEHERRVGQHLYLCVRHHGYRADSPAHCPSQNIRSVLHHPSCQNCTMPGSAAPLLPRIGGRNTS